MFASGLFMWGLFALVDLVFRTDLTGADDGSSVDSIAMLSLLLVFVGSYAFFLRRVRIRGRLWGSRE